MTRFTVETHPLDATEAGHRTEFLYDDGENADVATCAAHGGHVEPGTGEQALELAVRLPNATCWACLGYSEDVGDFDRWHATSTDVEPADYPLLARIADRGFETVISFHGLAEGGVLVGGDVDPSVKRRVADRLDGAVSATVETVSTGPYAGVHADNFVNWLARSGRGGLQIEQGPSVRREEGHAVTAALEGLLDDRSL